MRTFLRISSLMMLIIVLVACPETTPPKEEPEKPVIEVSIVPTTVVLEPGEVKEFTATVEGTENKGVTWGTTGGRIVGTGATITYNAPLLAGTYTLTAASVEDAAKKADVRIEVKETPSPETPQRAAVIIQPQSFVTLEGLNDTYQLEVVVYDNEGKVVPNPNVTWQSSDAESVSVDAAGLLKAEVAFGQATVTATFGEGDGAITSGSLSVSIAELAENTVLIDSGDVVTFDAREDETGTIYLKKNAENSNLKVGDKIVVDSTLGIVAEVTAVDTTSDPIDVTVKRIPLGDAFERLSFTSRLQIDLDELEQQNLQRGFADEVSIQGNTITTQNLFQELRCKTEVGNDIKLEVKGLRLDIDLVNPDILVFEAKNLGWFDGDAEVQLGLDWKPKITVETAEVKLPVDVGVEVELVCKHELAYLPFVGLPIPGGVLLEGAAELGGLFKIKLTGSVAKVEVLFVGPIFTFEKHFQTGIKYREPLELSTYKIDTPLKTTHTPAQFSTTVEAGLALDAEILTGLYVDMIIGSSILWGKVRLVDVDFFEFQTGVKVEANLKQQDLLAPDAKIPNNLTIGLNFEGKFQNDAVDGFLKILKKVVGKKAEQIVPSVEFIVFDKTFSWFDLGQDLETILLTPTLSQQTAKAGDTVSISAEGFVKVGPKTVTPNRIVFIRNGKLLGEVTQQGDDGKFTLDYKVTDDDVGAATVRAVAVYFGVPLKQSTTQTALEVTPSDNAVTPRAVLLSDKTNGFMPLEVTFDGSESTGSITGYEFDPGDNTGGISAQGKPKTFKYTYNEAGTYTAKLIVYNGTVPSDASEITITVAKTDNLPPVAVANITPINGAPPFEVTLDASQSSDPDNDTLRYIWSIDEKPSGSSAKIVDASAQTTTFRADVPGSYSVRLTVSDGKASDTKSRVVTAREGGETCAGGYTIDKYETSKDIATVAKCNTITGDLAIYDTELTNLSGLENLSSVVGTLSIYGNSKLKNLTGLDNLVNVGELQIEHNSSLTDLQGLNNLTTIIRALRLGRSRHSSTYRGNSSLVDISALANLQEVDEIEIRRSPITSLDVLQGLTSTIDGNILISELNALSDLKGLDSITTIEGNLQISGLDNLGSLQGLEKLTTVEGNLIITDNDQLENLAELANVQQVGGKLSIGASAQLETLEGLEGITEVAKLEIFDNDDMLTLKGLDNLSAVNGDVAITDSEDLEDLSALSKLTTVKGVLGIRDNPGLETLAGLEGLSFVKGLLIRDNRNLASLKGLDNIASIGNTQAGSGDYLEIDNNDALSDISALSNLTFVRSYVSIRRNDTLENLDGLNKLARIRDSLLIHDNPALEDIKGLSGLTRVDKNIAIYNNPVLATLDGLESLQRVDGVLGIGVLEGGNHRGNAALTSIKGLKNLTRVAGIRIDSNPSLASLEGLESLTKTAAKGIIIERNNGLITLKGLDNLVTVATSLYIGHNPALINVDNLSSLKNVGNDLSVVGNATLDHIKGLSTLQNVRGTLYIQNNSELVNLEGLEALANFVGNLNVSSNPVLASLKGLDNLTTVVGSLIIAGNSGLTSIANLGKVTTISGNLTVQNNAALTTLDGISSTASGLRNLQTVGGLNIESNESLVNLTGLNKLSSVNGNFYIQYNKVMTSLNGLDVLGSIGANFSIYNNPSLTDISALESVNEVKGSESINSNPAFDCSSYNEKPYSLKFFPVNHSSGNKVDCVRQ